MTYQEPRNLKEIITEIRNFYNLEELKKFLNLVEIPLIPYSIFLAIFFEIIKDGIRGNYGFLVILFLSFSITIIFGSILLYYCLSRKNILASFFGFGVFLIPLALILFNPASAFSIIEGSLVIVILFLTMTTVGLIVSIIKVFEKRLSHFFQNGWRYFISIFNYSASLIVIVKLLRGFVWVTKIWLDGWSIQSGPIRAIIMLLLFMMLILLVLLFSIVLITLFIKYILRKKEILSVH